MRTTEAPLSSRAENHATYPSLPPDVDVPRHVLNKLPHPQVVFAVGFFITKPEPSVWSTLPITYSDDKAAHRGPFLSLAGSDPGRRARFRLG